MEIPECKLLSLEFHWKDIALINSCKWRLWVVKFHFISYGVEIWGPSLIKANHWKDLERPLVSMVACMIRSKASVPHDIIWAEMGAAPIISEALFRSMTFIQRLWELPKRSTQGWHLCHQDNWLKMETFIVGMLKCSNGLSHMAWV